MTDTVALLATVPLFSSLDKKELQRLAKDFSERTFPARGTITNGRSRSGSNWRPVPST